MLTAGDLEQLRSRLRGHESVALHLGDRFGGSEWAGRMGSMLRTVVPSTAVAGLVEGVGPYAGVTLPLERRDDAVAARPRYRWTEGPMRSPTAEAPGASAVLVIDDAEVEPGAWRALPARAVGSCRAPMNALAAGQEQSLAELEPFLDHADAVLWQVYRPALSAIVPRLAEELEPYEGLRTRAEFDDNGSWEQYQCGHAYWEYLQNFARCGEDSSSCPSAPRIFLIGGARIGTAEPSFYIPDGCAAKVGRDYVVQLRDVASEAAQVAQEHLASSWVALADRLGAVTEVYEALEDVCTPRRRRFAPEDLEVARQRLTEIGEALASDEMAHPRGQWTMAVTQFHVPGYGPVQQVAEYDAGVGSPSESAVAQARGLRELLLQRALCRSAQPALPLATALVDGDTGQVEFFGFFFEEELFCGELSPLWTQDGTVDAEATEATAEEPATVTPEPNPPSAAAPGPA